MFRVLSLTCQRLVRFKTKQLTNTAVCWPPHCSRCYNSNRRTTVAHNGWLLQSIASQSVQAEQTTSIAHSPRLWAGCLKSYSQPLEFNQMCVLYFWSHGIAGLVFILTSTTFFYFLFIYLSDYKTQTGKTTALPKYLQKVFIIYIFIVYYYCIHKHCNVM